jgi:hypothetical protein
MDCGCRLRLVIGYVCWRDRLCSEISTYIYGPPDCPVCHRPMEEAIGTRRQILPTLQVTDALDAELGARRALRDPGVRLLREPDPEDQEGKVQAENAGRPRRASDEDETGG